MNAAHSTSYCTPTSARTFPGTRVLGLALALSLGAAGACHRGPSSDPSAIGDEESVLIGPIPVLVDNRNQAQVSVYAFRGSVRQRIGTIAGLSQAAVIIPAVLTNDRGGVSLQVIQLAGGQTFASDVLVPKRGERLRLTVEPRLSASIVAVE
ncbi:MAG: hypothetical protein H0W68_11750 [Gemmatimonadaceae bacterium]|nr:hypothetical protein [Gemmatimonadaceae bacterium]